MWLAYGCVHHAYDSALDTWYNFNTGFDTMTSRRYVIEIMLDILKNCRIDHCHKCLIEEICTNIPIEEAHSES